MVGNSKCLCYCYLLFDCICMGADDGCLCVKICRHDRRCDCCQSGICKCNTDNMGCHRIYDTNTSVDFSCYSMAGNLFMYKKWCKQCRQSCKVYGISSSSFIAYYGYKRLYNEWRYGRA